jgi:protocatechuate 3,4-dioxygenase beta subunit
MKFASLLIALMVALPPCAAQTAQPAPSAPADHPAARIEGKTVNAVDNTPLRNVEIALMGNDTEGFPHAAKSDAEGHFSFPNVTPGTYYVSISRTGFVTRRSTRALLTNGGTITLSEGEKMVDAIVPLWPAAVIRGKVLDPGGEPVANASVSVIRPGRSKNIGRYNAAQSANTDDNGDFRLFGLAPGRYIVMASSSGGLAEMAGSFAGDSDTPKETRTVPTYYPGTADYRQATPITLRAGDELPLNIMLTTARTVHVRGSISGKAPPTTFVMLMSFNEFSLGGRSQVKDGKFDIAGVAPGRYMLQAISVNEGDLEPKMAHQTVEVGPTGADNIIVTLGGHSQVIGSVAAEGGKLDFKKLRLMLLPADMSEFGGGGIAFSGGDRESGRIKDDGSIAFKDLDPGRYRLMIIANSSGLEDWYTKSIRVGTQDVIDSGIEVAPDATLAVQVILSADGGTIEGVAVDDKEKPWPNVAVIAVPDSKHREDAQFYGNASADQHGRFKMRGLAPSEYTLFALENRDTVQDLHDPETLKSLEGSGVKVKVEERSRKTVQPKVIPISDDSQ